MNRTGYIRLTLEIEPEDGQYTAACRELDVATCGDTVDEALENIREAVSLYVTGLEEVGERDRVFREKGIRIYPEETDEERLGETRPRIRRDRVLTMTETVPV